MRIGVGTSYYYAKCLLNYKGNNWRKRKGLKVARVRQMDKACYKMLKYERATQRGTWLKENRGGVEYTAVCSECGYATFWSDAKYLDICPDCETKMEMENEKERC